MTTASWSEKYRADGLTRAALDHAQRVASLEETRKLVRPGMRVLEAGSGTGRLAVALAALEAVDVVGADNSEGALQTSRRLLEEAGELTGTCEFVEADLYRLPFDDESFDLVFSDSVWEHLDDPVAAVREVTRVLRRGGSFVFTIPNRWRPDGWDLYRKLARPPYRQDSFSPPELRRLAAAGGLEPVRLFGEELWLERNVALLRTHIASRLGRGGAGRGGAALSGGVPAAASEPSRLRATLRDIVALLLPRWLRINVGVVARRP